MRNYKKELIEDLDYGRKNRFKVVFVEANPEKGFNYSYFVYIPDNPKNTIMMDCLNDYEEEMPDGQTENLEAMKEIYSLFNPDEITRSNSGISKGKEEDKEKTMDRMYYRLEKGINALATMIGINPDVPAIVPLIPGYNHQGFDKVTSQLDKDVITEVAPQIKAIIKDAKDIIEEKTGAVISDKVIPLGHSKSCTFANNFSVYYPEMCEGAMLGGGDFGTLPIDEIVLQIIDDDKITDSEKFQMLNGKVIKKITQAEFDRISQEYNETKKDFQNDITVNEDGTYNLPTNFPFGIADIEHYRDLPNGKEEYRQALKSMPKMIFIGEQEDIRPGHYAYMDGKTTDGIDVKAGDDVELLEQKLGHSIQEIEIASMHNRILEYIAASNSLFGRSSNERLQGYMQLYNVLNMPVQSKIYEGVGHANYKYSDEIDSLDKISSNSIYTSSALKRDIALYYDGAIVQNIPELNNIGRVPRN